MIGLTNFVYIICYSNYGDIPVHAHLFSTLANNISLCTFAECYHSWVLTRSYNQTSLLIL